MDGEKNMVRKISNRKLKEILSQDILEISDSVKDEMAIPSYLHWNPFVRWLMWRRYECISYLSELAPEMAVLEFGCGTGVFLPELIAQSNEVYAIDLFPQYAKLLCKSLNLNVHFKDNISEIQDNSLDIIIAADVLEHMNEKDLETYLKAFKVKLKSNGRLIVSGPTESFFYKVGRVLSGFGGKGDYHKTNINDLIDQITKHFVLNRVINLPFSFLPSLFKVCEFKQSL